MDRENIKTIILTILVIISIFLTSKTWLGVDYAGDITSSNGDFIFDDNLSMLEIMAPDKIVAHLKDGKVLVMNPANKIYDYTWENLLGGIEQFLAHGEKTEYISIGQNIWEEQKKGECLELIFKTPFNLQFWNRAFNIKTNTLPDIELSRLIFDKDSSDSLFLFDDKNRVYYKVQNEHFSLPIEAILKETKGSEELEEFIELPVNILGLVLETGIYVPIEPMKMSDIAVVKEDIKPDTLVKDFFSDMSVVRRIEEKDGARIYTDGQKGFRIYPSGAVEFNHAITPKGDYSDDLFDAAKVSYSFLITYGGLPADSYIVQAKTLEHDERSSKFTYDYRYNGAPVLGERNAIEIVITQGEVKNYYRNLEHPVSVIPEKQALSIPPTKALEIAAANLRFLIGAQEDKHKIKDVYLGYYRLDDDAEYVISPVWIVELKDIKIFIDALKGTMISLD